MADPLRRIDKPELFFGFVAPIGVDIHVSLQAFRKYLTNCGYDVHDLKVTDIFPFLENYIEPETELDSSSEERRLRTYIKYGNQIRSLSRDDQLAALTILRIVRHRTKYSDTSSRPVARAYLLYQFKHREEINLLRSVYGRVFFQISVYSRRDTRVDRLSRRFGDPHVRSAAEDVVAIDEAQDDDHGQQVSRIFHDADLIVDSDDSEERVTRQVDRFCDLLFGCNKISPTRDEYGMFVAKAAALRTLDLSRQVGAAIFTAEGEVISIGSNEVPKAGGGTYWEGDERDDRDYRRGFDPNERRKKELLEDLLRRAGVKDPVTVAASEEVGESRFMDALEYGRIIHAEMSAICDAARLGRQLKNSTLYCTTFPCHMCAKHIVAAGIARVVFLEPYPKSLAIHLHADSISIDGSADRGVYATWHSVHFKHFNGISPRRYRELFERGRRKDKTGKLQDWIKGQKQPIIDLKSPFYFGFERAIVETLAVFFDEYGIKGSDLERLP